MSALVGSMNLFNLCQNNNHKKKFPEFIAKRRRKKAYISLFGVFTHAKKEAKSRKCVKTNCRVRKYILKICKNRENQKLKSIVLLSSAHRFSALFCCLETKIENLFTDLGNDDILVD